MLSLAPYSDVRLHDNLPCFCCVIQRRRATARRSRDVQNVSFDGCEWDGDEEDLAGTSQDNRSRSPRKATALRGVVGIGADVAHTPKTIRIGATRSLRAVIFRADEFSASDPLWWRVRRRH